MKLQEIFNQYSDHQVVLSLSNNNEVLVTEDSFNPNSKFARCSRVRLGVDFIMSGVVQGDVFIYTKDESAVLNSNAVIYRTNRGGSKNDYVLYIYKGEYKLLEHYKKITSCKSIISNGGFNSNIQGQQLTFNSNTKPDPDKVLDITPHLDINGYYIIYKNPVFGECRSKTYIPRRYPKSYYIYMEGVLCGLSISRRYADKINLIRIHWPEEETSPGVHFIYKIPLGHIPPWNSLTQDYLDKVNVLKKELQDKNVSICFMK